MAGQQVIKLNAKLD